MAFGSDSISLIFKAKGDTEDAQKAFKEFREEIKKADKEAKEASGFQKIAHDAGLSSDQFLTLKNSLGLAAGGFSAIAAVMAAEVAIAVKVTSTLWDMAVSASEAGSKIWDAQQKTGLAAATLSTLRGAAELAGSSLENVTASTAKFARLLGEAQAGNEKAQETLRQLGVTSYDLDTALSQVSQTIHNAKDGTEQLTLAQQAFGRSGADMIPVIKQFGGDLEAATKEAERLGITLSESDIKAADDFGDTLGTLNDQVSVAAQRFALEFAPEITRAMQIASEMLADNQDVIRAWGGVVADVIRGAVDVFQWARGAIKVALDAIGIHFATSAAEIQAWARAILFAINPVLAALYEIGRSGQKGETAVPVSGVREGVGMAKLPTLRTGGGGGRAGGGRAGGGRASASPKDDADRRAKEAFRTAVEEMRRQLQLFEAEVNTALANATLDLAQGLLQEAEYNDKRRQFAEDVARKKLELLEQERQAAITYGQSTVDIDNRIAVQREAIAALVANNAAQNRNEEVKAELDKAKKLEAIAGKANADRTKAEKAALDQYRKDEVASLRERIKSLKTNSDEQMALRYQLSEFLKQIAKDEYEAEKAQIDALLAAKVDDIKRTTADEKERKDAIDAVTAAYEAQLDVLKRIRDQKDADADKENAHQVTAPAQGALQDLIGNWDTFKAQVEAAPSMGDNLKALAGMMTGAFRQMASAVGSLVQQWVLYGDAGPHAMRKMLAAVLASLAAEAAVRAVFELAMGFAALVLNPAAATKHFIAAALFGSIAGVSAIAGRAVAGDTFKQETSNAYGSAGSASGSGRNTGGQAYSSQGDQIVETGRNAPISLPKQQIEVTLRLDSRGVLDVLKDSIRGNGEIRRVIAEAV